MKIHSFSNALLLPLSMNIAGCSSLQSIELADKSLSAFLAQPQHYAFFTPVSIESEDKLGLLGVHDYGQRISQQYGV